MNYKQIIQKIGRLSLLEKVSIVEIILKDIDRESQSDTSFTEGVKALVEDYANDKDLTAFTTFVSVKQKPKSD
jgi:hypothetical protein